MPTKRAEDLVFFRSEPIARPGSTMRAASAMGSATANRVTKGACQCPGCRCKNSNGGIAALGSDPSDGGITFGIGDDRPLNPWPTTEVPWIPAPTTTTTSSVPRGGVTNVVIFATPFYTDKLCGPDVTDFLLDALWDFKQQVEALNQAAQSEHGEGASGFRSGVSAVKQKLALDLAKPGGVVDLKPPGRGVVPGECLGCNNVPPGVTLCGLCVSNETPGNIAFGFAAELAGFGRKWALDFSEKKAVEDHKRDPIKNPNPHDSVDDRAAINSGADRGQASSTADSKAEFRNKLCEAIKSKAASGDIVSISCAPCAVKYTGHPKGT